MIFTKLVLEFPEEKQPVVMVKVQTPLSIWYAFTRLRRVPDNLYTKGERQVAGTVTALLKAVHVPEDKAEALKVGEELREQVREALVETWKELDAFQVFQEALEAEREALERASRPED